MSTSKFYAVKAGKKTGVFRTWPEAKALVDGFRGAQFKSFTSLQAAQSYLGPAISTTSTVSSTLSISSMMSLSEGSSTASSISSSSKSIFKELSSDVAVKCTVHNLPAQKHTVRKEGPNISREFFKCGAEPQCDFFEWAGAGLTIGSKRSLGPDSTAATGQDAPKRRPVNFLASRSKERIAAAATHAAYTDGSCFGNQNVATTECAAGWAAVMVELTAEGSDGDVVVELFGPVVTPRAASRDPSLAPLSVGAEVGSNNTGELCGIVEALLWARAGLPTGKALEIRYDSEYACKVVTGVYRAVKNVALVARGQQALRDAIGAGLAVTFVHVKGHSGDPGNDRADALAKSGASGSACGVGRWAARAALGPKSNAADYLVRSLDPCSGQGSTAHESRPAVAACSPSEHDLPRAESNKERALSLAPVLVVDVGSESSDDDVTILK